jgi:hypothetical protein
MLTLNFTPWFWLLKKHNLLVVEWIIYITHISNLKIFMKLLYNIFPTFHNKQVLSLCIQQIYWTLHSKQNLTEWVYLNNLQNKLAVPLENILFVTHLHMYGQLKHDATPYFSQQVTQFLCDPCPHCQQVKATCLATNIILPYSFWFLP